MATLQKRGSSWRVMVRRAGYKPMYKSFKVKAHAEAWARGIEHKQDQGEVIRKADGRLHALMDRYAKEVSMTKRGGKWEKVRLARMKTELPDCKLSGDMVRVFLDWRDTRLGEVSGSSVHREMNLLSSMFNCAIKEWRIPLQNPIKNISRPKENAPRDVRVTDKQLEEIVGTLRCECHTKKDYINPLAWFAVETGMRKGEILALQWSDVGDRWVTIRTSKTGKGRVVPLSERAKFILDNLPRGEKPFPIGSGTADVYWRKVRPTWLHLHDLRHEALSRMAKFIPVHSLAKISGHEDINVLTSVYYNPTPEDLLEYFTPQTR